MDHTPLSTFAIVDDHPAVADIVGDALEKGLHARCVGRYYTIDEALQGLPITFPQVVVTDWRIQNETCVRLLAELRDKLPATRWLLFTAWPTTSVLREALPLGITGCISKSSDYHELVRGINELFAGGGYFCRESMVSLGRATKVATPVSLLNKVERAILREIAGGLEAKEIGPRLHLSAKTVYNYITIIREKLQLVSFVDLARFAVEQGIAPSR